MARPIKKGIDYFNLDVNFFQDIKIRKIVRSCGNQSIAILICLLCNIYRDDGYYMWWDEDIRFLVADDVDAKESAVQDVVTRACAVGFFDDSLFKEYGILTSKRIQENYKLASKQKKDSSIKPEYLLPRVSTNDNGVSMHGNGVNKHDNPHSISEQNKSDNNKQQQPAAADDWQSPMILWQATFGILNTFQIQLFEEYSQSLGVEIMSEAVKRVATNASKGTGAFKYLETICKAWVANGVKSLADIERLDQQHENAKLQKKSVGRQFYNRKKPIGIVPSWMQEASSEANSQPTEPSVSKKEIQAKLAAIAKTRAELEAKSNATDNESQG